MNSLNDSGEFQEVESNHSGRLSPVPSQPAPIPSSRTLLSRDKRLPLDTWNTSGIQENVKGINFLHFVRSKIITKELNILRHVLQDRFQCMLVQELLSEEMKIKIRGTIPMPTFARRTSTMSSLCPVDIPQNSIVGQQRQQISELQFDYLLHSYVRRYDSKTS